jgi:hypothetical protein
MRTLIYIQQYIYQKATYQLHFCIEGRLDRSGSSPDFHQYHIRNQEQKVSEVLPTIRWDHGGNERLLNRGSAKMILQSLVGTQGIGGGAGSIALVAACF